MACHRQSPTTPGWPKSMRRLKGRSSCKRECWQKWRRTTRIWPTHSGLDGGRTTTAHWTSTWSTTSQTQNAASMLHARRTSCSGAISSTWGWCLKGVMKTSWHLGCRDWNDCLLRERFWWPGMAQRMMMSVRNCPKCRIFEAKPQIPPLEPILCTEPLDLVHIDYVSMEVTVGVKEKPVVKNVLVVKDHFTRYTQAYVTNNHTARTTACVLYNKFFSVFGFPRWLMSDQAAEFTL